MHKTLCKILLISILLLQFNVFFGQNSKSIRFENLGINEGLSQSSVYDITQDKTGFIWIATQDGLNRFDGVDFKTYYSSQGDSNSLLSNTINVLVYDSLRDWLWVGTDRGLNILDLKTTQFKHLAFGKFKFDRIDNILIDRNNTVWINTQRNGLVYYNKGKITPFNSLKNIYNIVLNEENLIVQTQLNSYELNIETKQLKKNSTYNYLTNIDKNYWLIEGTVYKVLASGEKNNIANQFPAIEGSYASSILIDGNNLWIGTQGNGVFLIDVIEGKLNHYKHQGGNNYSLGDNVIHTIFKDYSGVIWIGTDNNGVSKFDFVKQNIKHISVKRDDTPGLSSKIVWSISEDNNGNTLIGTDKGLDVINRFSNTIQNRNYPSTGNIQVINTENEILLGTSNSLYQISISNPSYIKNLFAHIKDSLFIGGISVHEIKRIDSENYWLGTTKGIIKFNANTGEYKLFNKKNSNLLNEDVRVIIKTKKGEWWVGSEGGLYKMYVINDEQVGFTSYLPNSLNPKSIRGSVITSIQEGLNGNLWIGTYDGGLNFMDIKTKEFKNFSVKDGLSNNAIYGILRADGKIWISTNKGISVLDEVTLKFTNYFESDGLQSNEFNAGAFFKSKYGELFFGGVNGVSHFFPRELKKNTFEPKLAITGILVNNEPLSKLSNYNNTSVSKLKEIELNYKENNITINLSSLHFSNSKKNKYRYFIREVQDTSLLVSNSGVINYTSLSPGEYTLVAYGTNGDGLWNNTPVELKIKINPPFWETIWFQIIAYSLLAFTIFSIIRLRIRNVRNQKKILEKLVKKRTNTIFAQKEEIEKQKAEIEKEKEKADKILYKIFPDRIAEKLKNKGKVKAELYKEATIMFADFVQFTKISSVLTPEELVGQLNKYFKEFDKITVRNNLIQIKTIGDSYMAVGGIPKKNKTNAVETVITALQIQCYLNNLREEDESTWEMRIGINTGEIVAGVLETKRPLYDIWGSAVNIASRIQDEGKANRVNISESTYRKVKPYFACSPRGGILAKNVGVINMYFVDEIKAPLSVNGEGKAPNAHFWTYVNANIESKIKYAQLEEDFLKFLKENLPDKLYYHSVAHTEDVIEAAERIGMAEGVFDENLILLKTAALIHDSGFIKQYVDNEPIGVEYAKEFLPKYGYTKKHIQVVCDLILATKIDFEPQTNLHKIIKDADLDYLGRDDFEEISDTLFQELLERDMVKDKESWDKMQVAFFNKHQYYTNYSKKNRVKKKQVSRLVIEERVSLYH